ncbi:MAG TPA: hypothetical protein VMG12_26090 [Polyangiaceae bacterium]|nr:hypothetical protein [Polyangiaceae bacterium]
MASQTKSESVDRTPLEVPASSAGASSRVIDAADSNGDASPASSVGASAAGQGPTADDEDVSLDELMMSDSNDGDEPSDSADADIENAASTRADEAAERPNEDAPLSSVEAAAFDANVEDDEAAALAAAAAAQEAAAAAAAAEADARMFAARRGSEPPASVPRASAERQARVSSPPPPQVAPVATEDALADEDAPESAPLSVSPLSTHDLDAEPATDLDVRAIDVPAAAFAADRVAADGSADLDVDDGLAVAEPLAAPRKPPSTPPAPRLDAPLPSFDIPEVESTRARRATPVDENVPSRVNQRGLASPLQLSEVGEDDDDDAVTHIGLPVVPEAPSDYDELPPGGFQPVDPGVAALQGFEPDLSLADARRATTRVVPRIDPAQLEQRRRVDTNPALSAPRRPSPGAGAWLSNLFKKAPPDTHAHLSQSELVPAARRRSTWLLDTVLPPLSLVLFGSGIGAGIMLLQPDRGARAQTQTVQSLKEAPSVKRPTTLAERAEAGDGEALFKITNMSPNERSSELTLALERGYQAQKQKELEDFARQLEAPSGLSTPNLTGRFLNFATSPETMLQSFSHLLGWTGSTGPDVLYAVWEKAPGGNRAASLAQQLLHSADQRAKATPALLTALDLRSATTCEDYLRVLPAVQRDGDQRCSATLRALKHTDGCGDDGQKDCFACLRDGSGLDDALKAIEGRAAPQL